MNRQRLVIGALAGLSLALFPATAHAMHLPEGILPVQWAGLWFLVAAPFVLAGLATVKRRQAVEPRYLVLVALVGSAIFVISCMPVPVPLVGSCSHPCGTGLGAVLIGPGPTVVVASIALLLQALLLAHGGLSTLGANIVSMGVVGAWGGAAAFWLLRRCRVGVFPAAFAAGLVSDWATYLMTSLELSSALHGTHPLSTDFIGIALSFAPLQVPLGIAEGLLTAVAYRFVLANRPELLSLPALSRPIVKEDACR
jgi:cobalt/nickel transport system permease protein